MNKKYAFIQRHLTATIFVAFYLIFVTYNLFMEGFILEVQTDIFLIMLPFAILGVILDYILTYDTNLHKNYKIFAQILPSGIMFLVIWSFILDIVDQEIYYLLGFIYWLFVALPFFISSYDRKHHSKRMLYSLLGVAAMAASYLRLTTFTPYLDSNVGAIIYFVSYFCMLYAASTIDKAPFISLILGIINAIVLYAMSFIPFSSNPSKFGWDFNIAFQFELLMLSTFIICILIRFFVAFYNKRQS